MQQRRHGIVLAVCAIPLDVGEGRATASETSAEEGERVETTTRRAGGGGGGAATATAAATAAAAATATAAYRAVDGVGARSTLHREWDGERE